MHYPPLVNFLIFYQRLSVKPQWGIEERNERNDGTRGIKLGMPGIRVGMRRMRGVRVGMTGIRVGKARNQSGIAGNDIRYR